MIDTNTNDDNLKLAAALLTESMKWVKQAQERMTKVTHVPKKHLIRLNKVFKKAQKQQLELWGLYSRKTWRTTKPPKMVK
jgi:predicted XRE-type DNA-binding protein